MDNVRAFRADSTEQQQIKAEIESFAEAFRSKKLDRILAFYAPDVIAFDMMPPLQYSGLLAWRGAWEKSLPMMTGEIEFEFRDLDIVVNGDLAVCHGLNHFQMKNGEAVDMWIRWTGAFRKVYGKWLVFHEHTSVPSDMETGKALTTLKP